MYLFLLVSSVNPIMRIPDFNTLTWTFPFLIVSVTYIIILVIKHFPSSRNPLYLNPWVLTLKHQIYPCYSWVFSGTCLEEVDKRTHRGRKGLQVDIIQPSVQRDFQDISMLTDKSSFAVLLYLHSGWTDWDRKNVWIRKARRRSRLFGCHCRWIWGLLFAGRMSVVTVRLHHLCDPRLPDSTYRGNQGAWLRAGNDCDYAKCPLCLSVTCGDGYGM